ncbi:MAG: nucleotide exchange factor GrpE [Micrococcales bacterium]|nr:nucleotide exchange factor GrpE [Micrococcales bacterium]
MTEPTERPQGERPEVAQPDVVEPEVVEPEVAQPEVIDGELMWEPGSGDAAGPPPRPEATSGSPKTGHHEYPEGGPGASPEPGGDDEYDHEPNPGETVDLAEEDTMAASLLADLQRLQAEYVNYKKRVDRDREVIRTNAVSGVVEALLPVLDDIYLARQAGDLQSGPFAAIVEKFEGILGKLGIERVGEPGDAFDPNVHEALMHVEAELPEGTTGQTVVQVFQPGYRNGDRLVRAARVSVADPP